MLIGTLVELHAWLYSYLCFSLLEKWFLSNLDTSSIPPQHLAICQALKVFSYCNLDRSSTVGGSNEKVLGSSTTSWHLVDQSSLTLVSDVFFYLNTCTTPLSVYSKILDTLLDTLSIELYWGSIYTSSCDPNLISLDLSLDTSIFLPPKPFSLTLNLFPKGFSSLIKFFLTWYVSNPSFSCISFSKT